LLKIIFDFQTIVEFYRIFDTDSIKRNDYKINGDGLQKNI